MPSPGDVVCGSVFIGRVVSCPPWVDRVNGIGHYVIALDDGRKLQVETTATLTIVQECELPLIKRGGVLVLAEVA